MLIAHPRLPLLVCAVLIATFSTSVSRSDTGESNQSKNPSVSQIDLKNLRSYQDARQWIEGSRDAEPDFVAGDVLKQSDLWKLRQFVPASYIAEMDFSGIEIEIQGIQDHEPHSFFRKASLQYGGQTRLAEDMALENYVAGRPFSEERIAAASDHDTAYMVAWNNVYRWQHFGYRTDLNHQAYVRPGKISGRNNLVDKVLIGGGTVERLLSTFYQRVYFSHLATMADSGFALDVDGADTIRYKDLIAYTDPFEMRGSSFVIERAIDAHERDQVNSYLPSQRRVRRLSPKERADSFIGSEFTLDDFEGFSGRVLDYEWSFLGERKILGVANSKHPHIMLFGPHSRVPYDRWQLRTCYVIEQVPRLKEHTYGRKLLFFDKQTFNIPIVLIFDREDRALKVLYPIYQWPHEGSAPKDVRPGDTVPRWRGNVAINLQTGIHTVVWAEETVVPDVKPSQVRRLFSVSNLTGGR